ncbi:hypothetical protein F5141DRAFT_1064272 [Pisolithus sp. B1]|nr:hypothetical protein F5141DRAFT_1064272 [Pisolithus sp. B1]
MPQCGVNRLPCHKCLLPIRYHAATFPRCAGHKATPGEPCFHGYSGFGSPRPILWTLVDGYTIVRISEFYKQSTQGMMGYVRIRATDDLYYAHLINNTGSYVSCRHTFGKQGYPPMSCGTKKHHCAGCRWGPRPSHISIDTLSSTTLSSTAPAQETHFHGLMWKGYEHEVVGYESSEVPHPTPTLNSPKDRSVVAAVQRAPSPAADAVWAGSQNQNTPQRLRREEDTDKEPRSPMPLSGSGAMWKGREHEEAV